MDRGAPKFPIRQNCGVLLHCTNKRHAPVRQAGPAVQQQSARTLQLKTRTVYEGEQYNDQNKVCSPFETSRRNIHQFSNDCADGKQLYFIYSIGQNVLKHRHELVKLKGLADEVIDSKSGESGIDSVLIVGTADDNFQVGPSPQGLFKHLAA